MRCNGVEKEYLVIKHMFNKSVPFPYFTPVKWDEFSTEFLGKYMAIISDAWVGISLKFIPVEEFPLYLGQQFRYGG